MIYKADLFSIAFTFKYLCFYHLISMLLHPNSIDIRRAFPNLSMEGQTHLPSPLGDEGLGTDIDTVGTKTDRN